MNHASLLGKNGRSPKNLVKDRCLAIEISYKNNSDHGPKLRLAPLV